MVTTKLYLDRRAVKEDKPAPLKIAVTKNGSTSYIPLGIYLLKSQWNVSANKVVNHPKKQFFNTYISKRKLEVDEIVLSMTANKETDGSITEIKNRILAIINPAETESTPNNLFCVWLEKFANNKNGRTKQIYLATLERIKKFKPKEYATLTFEDMNLEWLTNFNLFLAKTSPAKNARNIHFRNIRAVFNYAIDNEATSAYPFRKFKLKYEETRKRSMPVESLRKIMTADIDHHLEKYRDFFMLSFYLIGMNVVDICHATEIADGRLQYRRAKTHKLYSIKLEPEAAAIISKYAGEGQLLNYLDHHKSYRTFYNCLVRGLNEVKNALNSIDDGITFNELTSYWARHTWATIASDLDIPDATIAAALGHSYGNSTSAIYINFNMRKVDEANRRVIDWVLGRQ
ncbi:site-specific integrase [uncultured Duncaniella sp.]|uniref:site-specific integrase n=1 Tax=uncultured Duncaniella sp. TaxID=2768039 RepID=UPI0025A9E9E5|nr:site-specific integrase [uncultured Duncaniella sp.]